MLISAFKLEIKEFKYTKKNKFGSNILFVGLLFYPLKFR